MLVLRSIAFNVAFYAVFIVMMIVGLPVLLMPARVKTRFVRAWARVSLWLLDTICGSRIEFRNLHHLQSGPSILAVKHQSFLETFALVTAVDEFSYVLKKELLGIPLFGWYLKGTGQIGVNRDGRANALVRLQRSVQERLASGRNVIIFPEGTRRPVDAPPAYKAGVAALCARTGASCTPVALNTGLFWPRRGIRRYPGTVVIEFLPPIPPTADKREFMTALQTAIEHATDNLVASARASNPALQERGTKAPAAPILT